VDSTVAAAAGIGPQTAAQAAAARWRAPYPVSVKTLAHELPPEAWHNIAWREGSGCRTNAAH
jgi:hypothetical protein